MFTPSVTLCGVTGIHQGVLLVKRSFALDAVETDAELSDRGQGGMRPSTAVPLISRFLRSVGVTPDNVTRCDRFLGWISCGLLAPRATGPPHPRKFRKVMPVDNQPKLNVPSVRRMTAKRLDGKCGSYCLKVDRFIGLLYHVTLCTLVHPFCASSHGITRLRCG